MSDALAVLQPHLGPLLLGAALAALFALGGWATRSLSRGGAAGAFLVGTLVFGLGGLAWALLLILFFVSASLASRWHEDIKARPSFMFARGSRRDLVQVMANGGVPALLAVGNAIWPEADLFVAYAGAVAAVTADTFATEIGLLSEADPHLITTGEPVPRGTSGGVTVLGTLASVGGAALLGLVAAGLYALRELFAFGIWDLRLADWSALRILPIVAAAGLASAAVDSLLGATVQVAYFSERRQRPTERPRDEDGRPNPRVRGWRWVNNDVVNLAASAAGAAVAWLLWSGL